ncbi:prephenate dehydrogenase [Planomonospora corallina]|uniref:Prephenate dehydrogenase n=1 Tax=Planomonospora corallina TaxID=1806052 RepID=A0ABV8I468_9ACTN
MTVATLEVPPASPRVTGIRSVTVIGSGVIGTSVALAVRRSGAEVALIDADADAVAEAERMGAGVRFTPDTPPADVVVIATPPSSVARVLREAQERGLGAVYTDVASTKGVIVAEAARAGCDLTTYVPGHPMAGRELSGPAAARADMFAGRPWVLCPGPGTPWEAVRPVVELAEACRATVRLLPSRRHDRIVAAVSHTPHLVSAALAARFAEAEETVLSLAGKGLRDTTRIAAGLPELWCDILEQNAEPVAVVLDEVVRDLTAAAAALRSGGTDVLKDLLVRGNRGRHRVVDAFPAAESAF